MEKRKESSLRVKRRITGALFSLMRERKGEHPPIAKEKTGGTVLRSFPSTFRA